MSNTQTDSAYELIKANILSCKFAPGQKLRINEIANDSEVSLGAVREALARLSAEGMAVSAAQKGYSVPGVSAEDLINLTNTRIFVENECLAQSIAGLGIETETQIVAALHRLLRIPERNPDNTSTINPTWVAAHEVFHNALVLGCTNEWLLRLRRLLYQHSERYRALSVPLSRQQRNVNQEHQAIFDAVMAHDTLLAQSLMADHLQRTTDIIIESGIVKSAA
ncbi:MAG: GntR family transcriptional regulator [Rhodobacteraceae bacterium]|nr:GntR family transcriptional regulator [Paracoccaceae bacterium]